MKETLSKCIPCVVIAVVAIALFSFWLCQKSMSYNSMTKKEIIQHNKKFLNKIKEYQNKELEKAKKLRND